MVHINLKAYNNCNNKANNNNNNNNSNSKGQKKNVKKSNKKNLSKPTSKPMKANLNEPSPPLSPSSSKQSEVNRSMRIPLLLKRINSNRRMINLKPAVNQIANKYKTLDNKTDRNSLTIEQKCFKLMGQVPYEYKIANKLRLAMQEGQSKKPWENINLRPLVVKALSKGVAWKSVESILYECKIKQKIDDYCYLLEICYQENVFLIVNVYTKSYGKFKNDLMNHTLNKYRAKYDIVLQYFNYNCKIEALAPYATTRQFSEFERSLAKDAVDCRAGAVEIHDYETGAVAIQSHPFTLAIMLNKLEKKGYKVLYSDYGFEALKRVKLEDKEEMEYLKFLDDLQQYPEVKDYEDNVRISKTANDNI